MPHLKNNHNNNNQFKHISFTSKFTTDNGLPASSFNVSRLNRSMIEESKIVHDQKNRIVPLLVYMVPPIKGALYRRNTTFPFLYFHVSLEMRCRIARMKVDYRSSIFISWPPVKKSKLSFYWNFDLFFYVLFQVKRKKTSLNLSS